MVNSQSGHSVQSWLNNQRTFAIPPTFSNDIRIPHDPFNSAPNPAAATADDRTDQAFDPSYFSVKWYRSESIRLAARDLHNRIYIPFTLPSSRYDALYRPIITCAVDWSDTIGPYLIVRMWRWTGYFAPGGEGMIVEKFIGRHGLRHHKLREPVGLAPHLHQLRDGLPRLKPEMIKLPPNGTAKLLVPAGSVMDRGSIEVFLEGVGAEVIDSAIWEGNLRGIFSGIKIRRAESPLLVKHTLAASAPFRPAEVPNRYAYDPQLQPMAVTPSQVERQIDTGYINHPAAPIQTPDSAPPALRRTHDSPSDVIILTPAGEGIDLMRRVEVAVMGTFRLGAPGPRRR